MDIKSFIEERKKEKELLTMTHVICGYPSFEDNMKELEIMNEFGVDFVELQFPFSEPSADGPVFVRANEESLKRGTKVADCLKFMKEVSAKFDFKVLMMGYYNTCYKMGEQKFIDALKDAGACGYILPDLPVEEAGNLHKISEEAGLEPVMLMTPTNTQERLNKIGTAAKAFTYVVARKGVTGDKTSMSQDIDSLLDRCRQATDTPLAVGFGVQKREDLDFLTGRCDMAIIGTAVLRIWEEGGEVALRKFFTEMFK